jgi:hypothetical protein
MQFVAMVTMLESPGIPLCHSHKLMLWRHQRLCTVPYPEFFHTRRTRMANWQIEGDYIETCNCSFLCPCITANLAAMPTEGDCKAAIGMRITSGRKGDIDLSGLSFIVMLHSPGVMADGNIKVGLIVDESANDGQVDAITGIATGAAGGPMAALGPLVGEFRGVEKRPIVFEGNGMTHSVRAGDLLEQTVEGVPSASRPGEAICIDNTVHPVSPRLSLGKATRSRMHAFGIDWDDATGTRNGHFTRFTWTG